MFKRLWVLGGATAIILFLGVFAFSRPNVTEATLIVSEGEAVVEYGKDTLLAVLAATPPQAVAAGQTLALSAGDSVQLGEGATATLRLRDGSTVELSEEALLHIVELSDTPGSLRVRLFLFAGQAFSRVYQLIEADDAFTISTPSSTTSVRGTVFSVRVIDDNTTEVAVEEGLVWVTGSDGQGATVPAGYQLTVRIGEPLNVEPQPDLEPTAPSVAEATSPTPTLAGATPTPEGTRQPGPLIGAPFISPTPRPSPLPTRPPASAFFPPAARAQPVNQPATPTPNNPPDASDTGPAQPPPAPGAGIGPPNDPPPGNPPPRDPPPSNPPPGDPPPGDPPPGPPPADPPPTNQPPADPPTDPPGEPTNACPEGGCDGAAPPHVCEGPAGASNPHCRDR